MRSIKFYFGISVFWLALSMVFDGLNTLVIPDQLLNFTNESRQATMLGLITFIGLFTGMVVQPIAGVWSDRMHQHWGRRGSLGAGAEFMILALIALCQSITLPALIVSYVFVQIAASIAQAAQQGFIPDLVSHKNRGFAAGLKGLMDVGGALLGFVVISVLLANEDFGWALAAMGSVILITYFLTATMVHETGISAPQKRFSITSAFSIDSHEHRIYIRLIVSRFMFLLGIYAVGRFLLYFIADRLQLDRNTAAQQSGGLLAALTFVTFAASPLMGWTADRYGRILMMIAGSLLSMIGVLALIWASTTVQILLAGSLMAVGSAAFTTANWAMTVDFTPAAHAAQFLALANFGTAGAAAVAGLFGLLIDGVGYDLLFACSALVFLTSAGLTFTLPAPSNENIAMSKSTI